MRKLISLVLPAMIAASMTLGGTGCTVKVQAKETEEVKRRPPPPKEEPPPPPKKKPRIKLNLRALKKIGYELDLPSPVPFKTGSAELDDEAGADDILDQVRDYMATHPEVTVLRIEGHTDSDGDDNSNLTLSKQRAASVVAWLVAHNIDCKRLLPVGFGETMPLVPNDTPENKAKNRRVSFFDAMIKGKAVIDEKTKKTIQPENGGKVALDPCNPAISK